MLTGNDGVFARKIPPAAAFFSQNTQVVVGVVDTDIPSCAYESCMERDDEAGCVFLPFVSQHRISRFFKGKTVEIVERNHDICRVLPVVATEKKNPNKLPGKVFFVFLFFS